MHIITDSRYIYRRQYFWKENVFDTDENVLNLIEKQLILKL